MTKQTEALKMAIEAMERAEEVDWDLNSLHVLNILQAIKACKEALEQPSVAELNDEYLRDTHVEGLQPLTRDWKETINERIAKDDAFKQALEQPAQEPFAWTERVFLDNCKVLDDDSITHLPCANSKDDDFDTPLYTHPAPSWQGLSDDEISHLKYLHVDYELFDEGEYETECNVYVDEFARAIEQALKEKNNAV